MPDMFEDKNTEELMKLYDTYWDTIYGANSCYGTKDIMILHEIERELNLRSDM